MQRKVGTVKELTERKAREKLAQIIRDNKPGAEMTFAAASERYIELRKPHWGKNHHCTVASVFKTHIVPKIGKMRVAEIKPTHVQTLLNELAKTESRSLVKKARTHVGSVLEMLVEDEILNRNTARSKGVRKPKTKAEGKATLTIEECRKLLAVAKPDIEDYLILRMLFIGLRPSEVFGLRVNDLVFDPKEKRTWLRIDEVAVPCQAPRSETKTVSSSGLIPISEDLYHEAAYEYCRDFLGAMDPSDFLFATRSGKPMSHNNWRRRNLQRMATEAGIPHVDYRILRRTFATLSQRHGGAKDVQALMRHAKAATTLEIYVQEIPASVRQMAERWEAELIEAGNAEAH